MSAKSILVLASLGWTIYNALGVLTFQPVLFGLLQWPVWDWNKAWMTMLGILALYISVFRMEPRGRFLGGRID